MKSETAKKVDELLNTIPDEMLTKMTEIAAKHVRKALEVVLDLEDETNRQITARDVTSKFVQGRVLASRSEQELLESLDGMARLLDAVPIYMKIVAVHLKMRKETERG